MQYVCVHNSKREKLGRYFDVRASLQNVSVASFMSFDFMCTCASFFRYCCCCCCLSDISIENIKCRLFLWFTQKILQIKPTHTAFATVKSQQKPFGQMLQQQRMAYNGVQNHFQSTKAAEASAKKYEISKA